MPELAEIYVLSKDINERLPLQISEVIIIQDKLLNIDKDVFISELKDTRILQASSRGKWLCLDLDNRKTLLINLGMGADVLLYNELPKSKYQAAFKVDKQYLTFKFWWYGHIHLVEDIKNHKYFSKLGKDYIQDTVSEEEFVSVFSKKRGSLKNTLLNQSIFSGIGNYYVHDILFQAKIHPLSKCNLIPKPVLSNLYHSIMKEWNKAIELGGSHYEFRINGTKGDFKADKIAYKEDQDCPICKSKITKIKTSATSSYVCETCQILYM
jgi:formamidopyrimidine-DNA glycosylase